PPFFQLARGAMGGKFLPPGGPPGHRAIPSERSDMRKMNLQTIIGAVAGGLLLAGQATAQPTQAMEDFRAVWFTTVSGLDFPAGEYDIEEQRDRIIELLDGCQDVGINAVIFQVRGECDAYYPSDIEPWSRWLTGTQG